jgi:hypothetical protein
MGNILRGARLLEREAECSFRVAQVGSPFPSPFRVTRLRAETPETYRAFMGEVGRRPSIRPARGMSSSK